MLYIRNHPLLVNSISKESNIMISKKGIIASVASTAIAVLFTVAGVASALTTSCVGVPTATSITWTASFADGVAPVAFLWGNGNTTTVQTVSVSPGTYSMTLQATDASSTVATTTCSATVNATTTNGTRNDINLLIQDLINQINNLKAQIVQLLLQREGDRGGLATSTLVRLANRSFQGDDLGAIGDHRIRCIKFHRDLHFGDEGDDVRELQHALSKEDPSIFPPGLISGFFGKKTENALKHLQKRFGMSTSTGFFGPRTRGLLNGHCGNEHSVEMSTQQWTDDTTSSHDNWNWREKLNRDRNGETDATSSHDNWNWRDKLNRDRNRNSEHNTDNGNNDSRGYEQ
jgi:hypothetical protein